MIDDIDHGSRSRPHVQPKRLREPCSHCRRGRGMVDRQLPVEQRRLVEVAEEEIAVRHRRLGSAAGVAYGAGIGAGALRPDPQSACAVDPCNRSAAGGNLGKIDDRSADRMPGSVHPPAHARSAADLVLCGRFVLSAADQTRLCGRTAHVE